MLYGNAIARFGAAIALLVAGLAAGCSLNPQPLPPGTGEPNGDSTGIAQPTVGEAGSAVSYDAGRGPGNGGAVDAARSVDAGAVHGKDGGGEKSEDAATDAALDGDLGDATRDAPALPDAPSTDAPSADADATPGSGTSHGDAGADSGGI